MSIEMDSDYDKVTSFNVNLMKGMKERLGKLNARASDMAVDLARNNLQNHQNISSGELLGSIKVLESNDDGSNILIGTYAPHAIYIEFGRGPVYPVTAKVLHWKDKTTGKDVFAKSAGPFEAMPFFDPAVLVVKKQYRELIIDNETKHIGRIT